MEERLDRLTKRDKDMEANLNELQRQASLLFLFGPTPSSFLDYFLLKHRCKAIGPLQGGDQG